MGQELTARIDSRGGNVPRTLRSVELPAGEVASVGDDLVALEPSGAPEADPVPVGTVTSAAVDPRSGRTRVLGFVKRSVGPGDPVGVRAH